MGLIGHEIIQSRVWIDPNATPPPNLNYKNTFPITVFKAVRQDMYDEDSPTLAEVLEQINSDLNGRQPLIPAKSADNLVTYGGAAGAIGSIQISTKIPYDEASQRSDRIPTEKAVGELLRKYGFVDNNGNATGDDTTKLLWTAIVGRPEIYNELGDDETGIVSQAAITKLISDIRKEMSNIITEIDSTQFGVNITKHISDYENPHHVTAKQIGAVDLVTFENHTLDKNNPHEVTKDQIGLSNVDNTSDIDKPISRATKNALDNLNALISGISGLYGDLKYVIDINYDQTKGRLLISFNDTSVVSIPIVTDGLVDEITVDQETNELVITELNGSSKRISIQNLVQKYIGTIGTHIKIEVNKDANLISASIIPKSITSNEILDNSLGNSVYADKSITGNKIADLTITTINYADGSITTEKIADGTIKDSNIETHTLTGRVLFTSEISNRILAVKEAGSDAEWMQVINEMIADNAISTSKLSDKSVTHEKIADTAVDTNNIRENAVTGDKIAQYAVLRNVKLNESPVLESDDNSIPDTSWVRKLFSNITITGKNIAPHSVSGEHLFSSPLKNRALIVTEVNGDAYWGRINSDMLDDESVDSHNIKSNAVTEEKLANRSVSKRVLDKDSVSTLALEESSVTSEKIFKSEIPNRVLAVGPDGGHPQYSQITREMMATASVGTDAIIDESITEEKLAIPDINKSILGFDLINRTPKWMKLTTDFIEDYSVTGEKIFSSSISDMVLAVEDANTPAKYMKITSKMLGEDVKFDISNIKDESITSKYLAKQIIDSTHILPEVIINEHIADHSIEISKLAIPDIKSRIIGIGKDSDQIKWMQIQTDMIEDMSVTGEKIFRSERPFRVLGSVNIGDVPDFIQITEEFIEDGSIGHSKLKHDLLFYGNTRIADRPAEYSNDNSIPDTAWVRKTIKSMMGNYSHEGEVILPDGLIDISKLKSSEVSNVILGVSEAGSAPQYMKVVEDMIENASITRDKLVRSIELLGSPKVEVRPAPQASDDNGDGELIPDCQWVIDRIIEHLAKFNSNLQSRIPCYGGLNSGGSPGTGDSGNDSSSSVTRNITIDDISDETILSILAGETEASSNESFTYNDVEFDRIDESILEAIVDEELIVEESSESTQIGDIVIEPISAERIRAIIDGEVSVEDTEDGSINLTLEGNSGSSCNCGCGNGSGVDYSYIIPISQDTMYAILNNDQVVTNNPSMYTDYGDEVLSISNKDISDMVDGTLEVTYASSSFEVKENEIAPIDVSRIRGIITGEIEPESEPMIDITGYGYNEQKGAILKEDSVITDYINDRAVTGKKLFTSEQPNKVLAVTDANTDPVWTNITGEMVEKETLTPDLFKDSEDPNTVISMNKETGKVDWVKVNSEMIENESINDDKIQMNSIKGNKIQDFSIGAQKLANEEMINTVHILDNAIDNSKIRNESVTEEKIADKSISMSKMQDESINGDKLVQEIELPAYTTVKKHSDLERRAIRNTIISYRRPTDGQNGDIWFRYS